MTFHVGQKVVCVDDEWKDVNWKYIPSRPVRGQVYTVRSVHITERTDGPEVSMLLNEITNPIVAWPKIGKSEGDFPAYRFRPVIERKTDISIFTAMLTPKQRERVDAR